MGRLIVFEETGEVRVPISGEYCRVGAHVMRASADETANFFILRRLTDEEVNALVAPHPADDERERFVRETAARQFEKVASKYNDSVDKWRACRDAIIDICIEDAESLAARLWEKRV